MNLGIGLMTPILKSLKHYFSLTLFEENYSGGYTFEFLSLGSGMMLSI